MTDINDILKDNWDTTICDKPDIMHFYEGNYRAYQRVIATELAAIDDEIMGIMERLHFTPDSHDAHRTIIASESYSDLRNILKGIKKVCVTFNPTSEEKIIQWERTQDWSNAPSNSWFECNMIIFQRKSGMQAY